MDFILKISQIITAILLVVLIMIQQRGTALGSAFGGESGGAYSTRRGIQKKIFTATIVLAVIFIALAVVGLII